ncbi:ABC transporter substrate-binding protein [Actinomyces sp. Marseille-P3109]|uniref:ABC transporter substrate-binding protein n=1 Tax=Actinomyces sp. Marseille-P3109 TaxID=2083009 RepID=UPI000D55C521|nr:ABC transporter substrate-binding protein [Actinomyces sp. Marseille-P3109]
MALTTITRTGFSHPALSRRHLLAGSLALTGTGMLAACSSGTASRAASASASGGGGALTIGLTYTPNIQFAPFYMATKDGKYATGVELRHHGAQEGLFDALQSGQEQLVVAGADEAVVAVSNGSDLVVVGGYYQSYPACLIVPEDSSINTPADLKGKTVGTPGRKGETWYALQLAMDTASLTESDLTIQDIGYTQQAALVGGKVDAVVGFSNNDAIQVGQSGTAVRTIQVADQVPLIGVSLVTSHSVLESRRQDLQSAVKASIEGMTAFVKDPDAAVDASKEHVQDLVDATQAARAREVAVATGKLVSGDGSHPIGSVRVDDFTPMIEFLSSHKLLGDTKTPQAADVCVPLGQ